MLSKATQLWADVLLALKKEVSIQSYETWLKPTIGVSLNSEMLTVEVPNKFFREWLVDHYYDVLIQAVGRISGQKLRLDLLFLLRHRRNLPYSRRLMFFAKYRKAPLHTGRMFILTLNIPLMVLLLGQATALPTRQAQQLRNPRHAHITLCLYMGELV